MLVKNNMTRSIDLSIVIPVYNSEQDLPLCLTSIKAQQYPKEKIEILLCDGGSTDQTIEIGKKFGCTIIHNPKKLAEFGVTLGMSQAIGRYVTILAADNELIGTDFITHIIYPFKKDGRVMITYPIQVSTENDYWISKYINMFTDPISHFVYGNASNTRTFELCYQTIQKNEHSIIYKFSPVDYPMIALAQGTTIRRQENERANPGDDILPIVDAITRKDYLAYVPHAQVAHHTISSLSQYFRKQRWAFDNYLLGSEYGIKKRIVYFSAMRKFKKLVWPIYAGLFVLPLCVSVVGYIITGKKEWLYHFPLTMASFVALVFELVRVTILRRQKIHRKT